MFLRSTENEPRHAARGLCGVAIFAAFLAAGIEASGPVSTEPTVFEEAQAPRPGRAGPAVGRGGGLVQTPPTTVPDLSGHTEQDARALLAKARLRVGEITTAEAGIKPGTVLKQTHTPGSQVAVGTPVGFAIAIPRRGLEVFTNPGGERGGRGGQGVQTPPTTVPDLSGHTEQDARALLAKARLRVGEITTAEAGIEPGTVLKQTHTPGSQLAVGTPVGFAIAMPRRGLDVFIPGGERGGGLVQTPPTTVPDLSGLTEQEARDYLAKARLKVGEITKAEAGIKPGTVLKQDHTPGSEVAVGTPVGFAIAIPITVIVPDVVGSTERDASATLNKFRLRTGAVGSEPSRSPSGRVLAQGPKAGDRVQVGSAVDLVIARPIEVAVPQLVGRAQREAIDVLKGAELVGGATLEESRQPAGTVLSQQPEAGTRVVIGSTVDFVTATPVTVLAPQLTGRTQAEAIGLLTGAELVLGAASEEESRRPAGTVLSQRPAAGTRVAIGSAVDIATATPVTVPVPQLVGRTQAEAMGLLKNVELVAGDVGSEEARRPPGTVLSQQPAAGTPVVIGTAVAIVAARPVTVLVPDVVSRSEADARQGLTNVELAAGTISAEESRRPPGSVLRQSVATGTRVTIGTAVDLVTATPVTVLVPGLVGQSEDSARRRLADLELAAGTIEYQESAADRGTVLAQSINPDTRAPLGTLVNLVVAVVETVVVPSVVGLPVEQAHRTLREGRLQVGDEQLRGTNVEPPGTVLAQNNVSGTRVAVGTPIVLTVAMPLVVTVPSVVGLPHDEAAAAIIAAGLVVGDVASRLSLRAGGTVLAQAAAPGEQVQFGAPVALDEARPRVLWLTPVALLFLAGLTGLAKARTSGRRPPDAPSHPADEDGPEPTPPIDFAVRANVDAGGAHVQPDEVPAVRREVRIQPVADGGSQELSAAAGDLVRGERRERKPDAPPPEEVP
jgi:beta-lactam-binding protein with PASTA domain